MPRPKKAEQEKRENRLTVYLTDQERDTLTAVAEREGRPMTQIVVRAVKEWIDRLLDPPEALKKAKFERIMEQQEESVRGFVCPRGHTFWIELVQPTDPRCCPVCGTERDIRRTWWGKVTRE